MYEQRYQKAIFIYRIIAVCSAVSFINLFFVSMSLKSDLSWLDDIGEYLFKGAIIIISAGAFVPSFVIIGLRMKMRSQKTDNKISVLEQEIERLKKK